MFFMFIQIGEIDYVVECVDLVVSVKVCFVWCVVILIIGVVIEGVGIGLNWFNVIYYVVFLYLCSCL